MKLFKRTLAVLLSLVMTASLGSSFSPSVYAFGEENLADATVDNEGTYFIRTSSFAVMPTNSRPGWVYVSLFDKTNSDSQKWVFTRNGDNYVIKNAGTNFTLHYGEGVKDAHVDQNGYDGTDYYKWKLKRVTSGTYNGKYMLQAVRKDGSGNPVYATYSENKRGVELYLKNLNTSDPGNQVFDLEKTANVNSAPTQSKANEIGQGYLNKYLVDTTQSNGSTKKSLGGGFWVGAELCEMMLDGYENFGDNRYRSAFESSYADELDNIGNRYSYWTAMTEEDWAANPFNDDITWLVLASVRAYLLFGNENSGFTKYLDYAKRNYQTVVDRGTKSDGSIRWSHEDGRGDGSNSCINGPLTVAACYLGQATGDESYYTKAKEVHAAQRRLMVNTETGQVYDTASNTWPSCYNQGTWIGACTMLYLHYHEQEYLNDAVKAMDYLVKKGGHFTDNYGVLQQENNTDGDLAAFRSILMRYVRHFITDMRPYVDTSSYLKWMHTNATVIYNNKNNSNLIKNPFQNATRNDEDYKSTGMAGGVALMLNVPKFGANDVTRDAYNTIEAEDLDYVHKAITENTGDSAGGGAQIAGTQNGYYSTYNNVIFNDKGAGKATFRVATISDSAKIEIRLDNPNGQLLGTANLPNTGGWGNFQTVSTDIASVTGNKTICLVYKGSGYLVNLNWFKFEEPVPETTTSDVPEGFTKAKNDVWDNLGAWNYLFVTGWTGANGSYKNGSNLNDVSIYIKNQNKELWGTQLKPNITLEAGETYEYTFKFNTTAANNIIVNEDIAEGVSNTLINTQMNVGDNTYTGKFTTQNGNESIVIGIGDLDNGATFTVKEFTLKKQEKPTTTQAPTTQVITQKPTEADPSVINVSSGVEINGYQISDRVGGMRTVYTLGSKINGQNVTERGLVYGLSNNIKDTELYLNSPSSYVRSYAATNNGKLNSVVSDKIKDGSSYAMTMKFSVGSSLEFTTGWSIRAYAKLSDGTIVYSDVHRYTIFDIADTMYTQNVMNNESAHNYLYNSILTVVRPTYAKINFDPNNSIVH